MATWQWTPFQRDSSWRETTRRQRRTGKPAGPRLRRKANYSNRMYDCLLRHQTSPRSVAGSASCAPKSNMITVIVILFISGAAGQMQQPTALTGWLLRCAAAQQRSPSIVLFCVLITHRNRRKWTLHINWRTCVSAALISRTLLWWSTCGHVSTIFFANETNVLLTLADSSFHRITK